MYTLVCEDSSPACIDEFTMSLYILFRDSIWFTFVHCVSIHHTASVGIWIPCKHLSVSIQYLLMLLSVMLFHLIFALPLLILLVKFGIVSLFMCTLNGIWFSSLTSYIMLILLILLWKSLLAITWSSQEVVFHLSLTCIWSFWYVCTRWNFKVVFRAEIYPEMYHLTCK